MENKSDEEAKKKTKERGWRENETCSHVGV
jgi:hypothetical protein